VKTQNTKQYHPNAFVFIVKVSQKKGC